MTKQELIELIKDIADRMMKHSVAGFAAQTAFFMILSIFPFLILMISLIQFLNITPEGLTNLLNDFLPQFLETDTSIWVDELYSHSVGTISISVIFLLWSSAKTLHCMKYGLDSVNEVKDSRRWIMVRFSAMAQTLFFIVVLGMIVVFLLLGSSLVTLLEQIYLDNGGTPLYLDVVMYLRYFLVFGILVAFITYAYTKLPNRESKTGENLQAGILCSFIWFFLSIFFSLYIRIYELFTMYGTLTTALMGLIWIYFMMMVFYGCAECNEEIRFFWNMYKGHRAKKKAASGRKHFHRMNRDKD